MSATENNAGALKRRANLRPFAKGTSGNPGGRPKAEHDVVAIAREKGPDAIRTLAEIMLNAKASDAARVGAANSLLERGFGKPTQTIAGDLTLHRPLLELTDDQLLALVAPQLAIEHCNEE